MAIPNRVQGNICRDILLGVATGDALGVPVEFRQRALLKASPVTDMTGYGTYNLPPGNWSDDASLTLCLAEALTVGPDLDLIAKHFMSWLYDNYWTAPGYVFDVGIATSKAIGRLRQGIRPDLAGGFDVQENGNGSLMRILPLLVYTYDLPVAERYSVIKDVSSITHGHVRSVIACFYYLELAQLLVETGDKEESYLRVRETVPAHLHALSINPGEIALFNRLLNEDIALQPEAGISSTGYVLHTLEAAVWCLMTTSSYSEAVLKAVNLGEDTDTTGAVTGGLAALLYGADSIPAPWLEVLARRNDIEDLATRLAEKYLPAKQG